MGCSRSRSSQVIKIDRRKSLIGLPRFSFYVYEVKLFANRGALQIIPLLREVPSSPEAFVRMRIALSALRSQGWVTLRTYFVFHSILFSPCFPIIKAIKFWVC